jgi:DNA-binding transcriptional MerR regulator/methylmalonyl-CoA mutase cobalamin-binding subunit
MTLDSFGVTIKTVSERTGVSVHTLRAWERRYGVPSPNRGADNRYRLYDEADIADVLFLKQQVELGVTPSQASLMLRQRQDQSARTMTAQSAQPIDSGRAALQEAFAKSDETTARQVLDEAFAMFTPEQVALQIIEPTMREIGERWMRNEMTVWQEHLASNAVQQKLFAVLQSQPALPTSAPLLAAACAPLEEHQLGLTIFALLARRQGWRVAYLGLGTPLGDIVDLARASKPNAIVVSVTTVVGLAGLIPWLDAANRPSAPLVFGGRMPNLLPALREHLPGDYLGDNAMSAMRGLGAVRMRAEYWPPSKRVLNVIDLLQAQRLGIAGEVVAEFVGSSPKAHRNWDASHVNYATLFLIDSLACALAFDVPELMDSQNQWLKEAMPPRSVMPQLIGKHLQIFESVLLKKFTKEQNRFFAPLIERMKNRA